MEIKEVNNKNLSLNLKKDQVIGHVKTVVVIIIVDVKIAIVVKHLVDLHTVMEVFMDHLVEDILDITIILITVIIITTLITTIIFVIIIMTTFVTIMDQDNLMILGDGMAHHQDRKAHHQKMRNSYLMVVMVVVVVVVVIRKMKVLMLKMMDLLRKNHVMVESV
jgi:sterol desaturase/sphingolipid hydroxylase (fatty acid hydroxylase superfamily)